MSTDVETLIADLPDPDTCDPARAYMEVYLFACATGEQDDVDPRLDEIRADVAEMGQSHPDPWEAIDSLLRNLPPLYRLIAKAARLDPDQRAVLLTPN